MRPEILKNRLESGYTVTVMTPFTEDDEIDVESLRSNIEFLIQNDTDGSLACLLPSGTNGEFLSLSDEERSLVIRTVVEQSAGRVAVVPGTMAGGTKLTTKMSQIAQDLGADGVMILTPYVYKVTNQGIMKLFETVANAIDIGIMIYNNPYNGNFYAGPNLMRQLAQIPQLVASKDISPTIADFYFGWNAVSEKIAVMDGWGEAHFSFTASQGCKSFFTNIGNYLPEFSVQLFQAAAAEDFIKMRKVMRKYKPLLDLYREFDSANGGLYLAIVKAGMDFRGLRGGKLRSPLIDLSSDQRMQLETVLEELGVESAVDAT